MQWMFMLLGAVLGWIIDESFSDALIGALLGLAVGLAIRFGALHRQVADQHRELEQAKKGRGRAGPASGPAGRCRRSAAERLTDPPTAH